MSVRVITGRLRKSDGTAWASATVKFVLNKVGVTLSPGDLYPPLLVEVVTDADGELGALGVGVPLWANAEGLTITKYTCTLPDETTFQFTLPDGVSSIDLSELKMAGTTTVALDDPLIAVIDSRIAAAGGSAWGGITGTLSAQTDLQTALNGKASSLGGDDNYVTDAEKVKLGNLSGTNTGDQDISGKANLAGGNALTGNQTLNIGQTTSAQTDLLINPTTKASGILFQASVNSVNKFSTDLNGTTITAGSITCGGSLTLGSTANVLSWPSSSRLMGPADGTIRAQNAGGTGLNILVLGGTSPATIGTAPAQGQVLSVLQCMELLTIAATPTSTTTMVVPAGAIVLSVSVRTTVVIPTAATYTVKIGAQVFNTAAVGVAANSTDMGTAAGAFYLAAATAVVITPDVQPAANTGRVRVTVSYILITPPTS